MTTTKKQKGSNKVAKKDTQKFELMKVQPMGKTRKIILTVIWFWLAISSVTCILLDLFMSVTNPEPGSTLDLMGIDQSFINQMLYLSTWSAMIVAAWSVLNLVSLIAPKMPKWCSNKNNATFVTTLTFVVFLVYLVTTFGAPDVIEGFDTPYKITKSCIEHFANPVILLITYFVLINGQVNAKKYASNQSLYFFLFITFYVVFLIVREAMLLKYWPDLVNYNRPNPHGGDHMKPFNLFPYTFLDPLDQPGGRNYYWVAALIAIEIIPYGLENLFSYLNNLSSKSMKNRYPNL